MNRSTIGYRGGSYAQLTCLFDSVPVVFLRGRGQQSRSPQQVAVERLWAPHQHGCSHRVAVILTSAHYNYFCLIPSRPILFDVISDVTMCMGGRGWDC